MIENAKIIGKITKISDIMEFDSGAKKVSVRIDTGEQWGNIMEFDMFKGADYAEHVENFSKYNKVGDTVEIEYQVRCNWNEKLDRVFTSLSLWKCSKVDGAATATATEEESDDLPF